MQNDSPAYVRNIYTLRTVLSYILTGLHLQSLQGIPEHHLKLILHKSCSSISCHKIEKCILKFETVRYVPKK